ncbi:hypothetical protein ACFFRR_011082 [Megaselia abdita]
MKFMKLFKNHSKLNVIGMVHLDALPGTPKYSGNFEKIVSKAVEEAKIYESHNLDGILIENMHDVPYVQDKSLGPEIVSSMTRIASEIKKVLQPNTPCGIQVLACGNRQALAIAKACDLQFIRAEGFVFGHVADEGYTDACAGELLRYRKQIDAEDVLVFTDLKKKHSSHSITADTSLLETAHAAEFFLTDGIVLTGTATGHAADTKDLEDLNGKVKVPLLIGSGVTKDNISQYSKAEALIIGSYFKEKGNWENKLSDKRISELMNKVNELRK